jgi:hypothetical protein
MAQNLIDPPRLNAPDVAQLRGWYYNWRLYEGHGRPTNTIAGSSVAWVIEAMMQSQQNGIEFFILYGLQEEQKRVCVVHNIIGSTLSIQCLETGLRHTAFFDHIWEIIPSIPTRNNTAEARRLQEIADRRVRRTEAIRRATLNEIQGRPVHGDTQSTVTRAARSTEVRRYRYE